MILFILTVRGAIFANWVYGILLMKNELRLNHFDCKLKVTQNKKVILIPSRDIHLHARLYLESLDKDKVNIILDGSTSPIHRWGMRNDCPFFLFINAEATNPHADASCCCMYT